MQYGNEKVEEEEEYTEHGLNRTMQYGNKQLNSILWCLKEFKSYYVVWKRFFVLLFFQKKVSLNRTMQYGN